MTLRGLVAGVLAGAALCAAAGNRGQDDDRCSSPQCEADKGLVLMQQPMGGTLEKTFDTLTETETPAGSAQEPLDDIPYLAEDFDGDMNATANATAGDGGANATANATAGSSSDGGANATANATAGSSSDGGANATANTTVGSVVNTSNTPDSGNQTTSNATQKTPDGTDGSTNKAPICATRRDERAQAVGYTTSQPGTPCVFGVDARDEGAHCVLDGGKYGSLGWCFTNAERTSFGSCNEHCPLFGQLKVIHDEIGRLRGEIREMQKSGGPDGAGKTLAETAFGASNAAEEALAEMAFGANTAPDSGSASPPPSARLREIQSGDVPFEEDVQAMPEDVPGDL